MTATAKRGDRREYRVTIFDGRAAATVVEVDGYGRAVGDVFYAACVRTEREAIAAYIERRDG